MRARRGRELHAEPHDLRAALSAPVVAGSRTHAAPHRYQYSAAPGAPPVAYSSIPPIHIIFVVEIFTLPGTFQEKFISRCKMIRDVDGGGRPMQAQVGGGDGAAGARRRQQLVLTAPLCEPHDDSRMPRGLFTMLILVVGVAWLAATAGAAAAEGAEGGDGTAAAGGGGEARAAGTPEVVLQLKYDGGELDRILLTQYRAPPPAAAATPALAARASVCADLCFAGLGGRSCGRSCPKLLPVGLKMALEAENATAAPLGAPRTAVCPVLCANNLGEPLCNCGESAATAGVDWTAVCAVFCDTDHYELGGCGSCEESSTARSVQVQMLQARLLSTAEGWQSWCNVQCRQGQGGAACNCDRAPFQ
ncbi:uncharacterized protein LOC121737622 [Aricia agestis]|uniref:uncharacterized protein LOC121737622 n=1 Tax=Aricia agestis TaxID=91739 RepID=UPI001C20BAFF|nr:uncharacterized protein LOC121737622 [Aricia agestis]